MHNLRDPNYIPSSQPRVRVNVFWLLSAFKNRAPRGLEGYKTFDRRYCRHSVQYYVQYSTRGVGVIVISGGSWGRFAARPCLRLAKRSDFLQIY